MSQFQQISDFKRDLHQEGTPWEEAYLRHVKGVEAIVRKWMQRGFPPQSLVEEFLTPQDIESSKFHSFVHPKADTLDFPRYCLPKPKKR